MHNIQTRNKMHRIKFPIGDWSDDGHGKCDWYIVKSNKTLKELIDAHFAFKEKAGFDIGEMCSEYEDSCLQGKIAKFVVDNKILTDQDKDFELIDEMDVWADDKQALSNFKEGWKISLLGTDTMLMIWLRCLKYADPELELEAEEDNLPEMINWNVDDMNPMTGRVLNGPGYGLFH
jgi:hypothetical protein